MKFINFTSLLWFIYYIHYVNLGWLVKVYWTNIEYEHCPGHPDYGTLAGGEVFVFLKAQDALGVLAKVYPALEKRKLAVVSIDFISSYSSVFWDTPEEASYYGSLAQRAEESSEVIFDVFCAYEPD